MRIDLSVPSELSTLRAALLHWQSPPAVGSPLCRLYGGSVGALLLHDVALDNYSY
jgi:hypothetical protein